MSVERHGTVRDLAPDQLIEGHDDDLYLVRRGGVERMRDGQRTRAGDFVQRERGERYAALGENSYKVADVENDIAVALTGAAGPTEHAGAAPGFVWIALDSEDVSRSRGFRAPGDREQVQPLEEHELQDQGEPERRHRHAEDGADPDHATRDLCAAMLRDSGMIQEEDAEFLNRH